jgi:hypothetical protein
MLTRRALAITPDKDFARTLKLALMAAGTVAETAVSVEALPSTITADLVAIHLPDNQLAPLAALGARLAPEAWVVVILDRTDLSATVDAMRAVDRVAGVLVAADFAPPRLAAMVTRLLHGDIFGLDKLVPWGTRIYSTLVSDYQEKSMCISQMSELAAGIGVRRKYREALEQCADEMLMNALYDAPVGLDGKPLFAEITTKDRIAVKHEQKVLVQYACDGRAFALSVRDSYGSFARETLLRYLHKCLHSEQQIDRKAGGAGLGLYLMANNATSIVFNLLPGVATEVICVFDITAPKLQLQHIGVYSEKVDAAGRLVAGPTRVAAVPVERRQREGQAPPATSRSLMAALVSAIALLVVLIGLVAYPRLVPPTGAVVVSTEPPGAIIEIDGRARGTTGGGPLAVDGLEAGTGHRVLARLDGHAEAQALIEVSRGERSEIKLTLVPRSATVLLESAPPGARVSLDGRALGVTPLSLTDLPPGHEVDLVLRHPGYRDTPRRVRVPPPGGQAHIAVELPMAADVASVAITSAPPGATVRHNGQRLAGLTTPVAEHLVEAGKRHRFTLELAGYMPATVELDVGRGQRGVPVAATLVKGGLLVVTANLPARVSVSNTRTCTRRSLPLECAIENGRHQVVLEGRKPYLRHAFEVEIDGGEVRREVRFGTVEAADGFSLRAGGRAVRAVALAEGRHTVTVVSAAGDSRSVPVDVRPGSPVQVP